MPTFKIVLEEINVRQYTYEVDAETALDAQTIAENDYLTDRIDNLVWETDTDESGSYTVVQTEVVT